MSSEDLDRSWASFLKEARDTFERESHTLKDKRIHEQDPTQDVKKAFSSRIPFVAKRLSMNPEDVDSSFEKVVILTKPRLNASIGKSKETGLWKVQVDNQLLIFYHQMAKLLATRVGVLLPSGQETPPEIPIEVAIRRAYELLSSYWNGHIKEARGFRSKEIPTESLLFSAAILNNVVRYTIGHELGHFVLAHLEEAPVEYRFAEDPVQFYVRTALGTNDPQIARNWTIEIVSDLIGFELALYSISQEHPINQLFFYPGCELLFTFFGMLTHFRYGNDHLSYAQNVTHPPVELRRHALREVARQNGFTKPLATSQILFENAWELVLVLVVLQVMSIANKGLK